MLVSWHSNPEIIANSDVIAYSTVVQKVDPLLSDKLSVSYQAINRFEAKLRDIDKKMFWLDFLLFIRR